MHAGWKILVLALTGYAIWATNKLLSLTDSAYTLAHQARFSAIDDGKHSLSDTVWGGDDIIALHLAMKVIGVIAAGALIFDLVRAVQRELAKIPPSPAG